MIELFKHSFEKNTKKKEKETEKSMNLILVHKSCLFTAPTNINSEITPPMHRPPMRYSVPQELHKKVNLGMRRV